MASFTYRNTLHNYSLSDIYDNLVLFLDFDEVIMWEDTFGTITAQYSIPKWNIKLKFNDASKYCKDHGGYFGQSADLAIGFTSEEIDFLLDQDYYRFGLLSDFEIIIKK